MNDFNISRGEFYRTHRDEPPKAKCFSGLLGCKKASNNNQINMESYTKYNVNHDEIDGVHIHAEPVKEAHLMATLDAVDKTMNDIITERKKEGKNPPLFFICWDHDNTLKQRSSDGGQVLVGTPDENKQQLVINRFREVNERAAFRCVISCRLGAPENACDIPEFLAKYGLSDALSKETFFEPVPEKTQGRFPQFTYALTDRVDNKNIDVPYQDAVYIDKYGAYKMPIACNIVEAYCNRNNVSDEDVIILFPDDTPTQHEFAEYYITGTPQKVTCVSILAARPSST
ncbi:hypothetical protein [Pantoea sp. App145]|uniref:hypothetical protein n=1 Tax=Pantoea sp. App145 TaxID=3071567 RepID=UPI003A80ABCA